MRRTRPDRPCRFVPVAAALAMPAALAAAALAMPAALAGAAAPAAGAAAAVQPDPGAGGVNPLQLLQRARPVRTGRAGLPGLAAPVTVERDDRGVPLVTAAGGLLDATRALGFVHAQERFFQMDLARRFAAGRVAELAGPMLRSSDESMRRLGLERVADAFVRRLDAETATRLRVYAEGVNAGLDVLGEPPIELQQAGVTMEALERWRPRDTVLVLLFMWDFLSMDARHEPWRGVLADAVDPAVFDWLTDPWHRDDTLADGRAGDEDPRPMPEAAAFARRGPVDAPRHGTPRVLAGADALHPADVAPGSNAWVVAGRGTVHGRAILAGDPHLMLAAPGVWYRTSLRWDGGAVHGVTLPGSPGVLIGSNERVAWTLTTVTGDFQDLVAIEVDPDDPEAYRTPDGVERFRVRTERIAVAGEEPVEIRVRETRWGPIVGEDHRGRPVALRWPALDPERISLDILRMATARDVDEALAIGAAWNGPSQNVLVAGADGRIGWTIAGFLPDRAGFDGRVPTSWADGTARWREASAPRPRVVDPPTGRIVSANNRMVPLDRARSLGPRFAHPGRAARIAERLAAMPIVDETAMLELQLDAQVRGYLPWRDVAVAAFAEAPPEDPAVAAVVAALAAWDGRATLEARVVGLLGELRADLVALALDRVLSPVSAAVRPRVIRSFRADEPALQVLEARPAHLLPAGAQDWDAAIRATVAGAVRGLGDAALAPWRDSSVAHLRHPLSPVVPQLSVILDMPPAPIPAHRWAVRVHTRSFGVSTRIVVAPGLEDRGICHIPAGQSGHPGERDYRSSHVDWVRGNASPLLPGAPLATLQLMPAD